MLNDLLQIPEFAKRLLEEQALRAHSEREIDELDLKILRELQNDGRMSFRSIGGKVGVAAATVRARLLQLTEDEVVEVVAVPNLWRLGMNFVAVVGLKLDPAKAGEVADFLASRREISWVGVAATGYEAMCEVGLRDAREYTEYRETVLARLPGFRSADVFLMSDVRKLRYRLQDGEPAEVEGPGDADE